ncbi:MAG: hypothetical protein RR350_04880 [Oscillibacter sp.]
MVQFLVTLFSHPLSYGWLTLMGVLTLIAIGFLLPFFGMRRRKHRWVRFLPAGICGLLILYAEARWSGLISFAGENSGFLPGGRMVAFAICFVALTVLIGILMGQIVCLIVSRKKV